MSTSSTTIVQSARNVSILFAMAATLVSCRGNDTKSQSNLNDQHIVDIQQQSLMLMEPLARRVNEGFDKDGWDVAITGEGDRAYVGLGGSLTCRSETACFLKYEVGDTGHAEVVTNANGSTSIKFKPVIQTVSDEQSNTAHDSFQKLMFKLLKNANSGAELVNRVTTPVFGAAHILLCGKPNADLSACDPRFGSISVKALDLVLAGGEDVYAKEYSVIFTTPSR
jgi:hypothetical protein